MKLKHVSHGIAAVRAIEVYPGELLRFRADRVVRVHVELHLAGDRVTEEVVASDVLFAIPAVDVAAARVNTLADGGVVRPIIN